MMNTCLPVSIETNYLEPFEDRIDILFRELELATKWQRPSVLLAVYSSEYVRADADIALENRLHNLGQSAYHIKIKNREGADVSLKISELANLENVVFFVEGLRWGADQDACFAYQTLNNRRDFFIENQIRVVFWLTEKEAIDLAHYAPDYWAFRHRVIEFVDSPKPDQISPRLLETAWQWTGEFTDTTEDLDAKIALRNALLTDLPSGNESTAARANLLLTLGILHWRRGDYERATQFLNTALDLAARLEDASFEALCFNAIALVQTDLGRTEEAIQAYQNAIGLAPETISPWNNLGHLYKKLGRHTDALTAFQKSIELNEADAVGWNGLGDLYHETGRNDDAIYAYLKAIDFSPDFAHSWCGLGNSHMEEGRFDEALAAHQKAIEIDRDAVNSWLGLGNIHKMQGNFENASMALQTALELDPRNAVAWNELGNLFYDAGSYDEAMRSYQKSIEFNQDSHLTYGNLASIYGLKGMHAEAIPLLQRELKSSSDGTTSARLWNQLGDAYRRLEDYDNAIAAYRKADSLVLQTIPAQTGPIAPLPDSQATLTESDDPLPALHLEQALAMEEPLQSEASTPARFESPESALIQESTDAPTRLDPEFVNWLDGLASVLPVTAQSGLSDADGSSPIEAGHVAGDINSGTEAGFQAYSAVLPTLTVEDETYYSSETSAEIPGFQSLQATTLEEEGSINSDQVSTEITEETDPVLAYDDQDYLEKEEADLFEETTPQAGSLDDGQDGEAEGAINEKNGQIWNELGNIYYNTGAFDEAMHAFEMAIELDPSYGWSYNNLASVHFHQKNYADAIPLYQKGLELLDDYKDKAMLWNRLGDAYRRLDDQDQAATAYRKAIELDPDNVSLLTRARFSLLGNLRA